MNKPRALDVASPKLPPPIVQVPATPMNAEDPPALPSTSYLTPAYAISPTAVLLKQSSLCVDELADNETRHTTSNRLTSNASSSFVRVASMEVDVDGNKSSQSRRRLLVRGSTVMGQDACVSPTLYRPTRIIQRVDSTTEKESGYVRLNQYKLIEQIGQGSYGIVKLAYNERDKNLYALKVLDKVKLTKKFACFRKPPPRRNKTTNRVIVAKDPLDQVHREIAILKKLNHPNVVKLVEVLNDPNDTFLYMVFEYVQRGAVMEIPTDQYLTEDTAWRYFRDTVMGLEYLHFQKIIHRDIKPSNLLLSDTDRVKIADFGVSSEFEGFDALLTGTAGTPAFMAPEAIVEESDAFYSGRKQDIWSLGVTLYAFVFGRVPFYDPFVIALHKKIKTDPLTFPETPVITETLRNLIQCLLTKDPEQRSTLDETKAHPWVCKADTEPLPSVHLNCHLVEVTDEEVATCVKTIPRLDTLILVKAMGRHRRFGNPFRRPSQSTTAVKRRSASTVAKPITHTMAQMTINVTDVSNE